ncbi:MAG: response regulator [Alphaproteobacteria bacterium]
MNSNPRHIPVLVADDNRNIRRIVCEVLRGAGFNKVFQASDGQNLLQMTAQLKPRIVITASRLPSLSGLEFTRLVRASYEPINPALSIIVMTTTPTTAFLSAARESGVDEMLACPFAPAALLARIEAVLVRPRRFIKSAGYVGPCRRRRMLQDYEGTLRRESDQIRISETAAWEAEANRELVRQSVKDIIQCANGLTPDDYERIKALGRIVEQTEELADEIQDHMLASAAKSLQRYIAGMRASHTVDPEVIAAHVNAMQLLSVLSGEHTGERQSLVDGLTAVVDKRLGGAA